MKRPLALLLAALLLLCLAPSALAEDVPPDAPPVPPALSKVEVSDGVTLEPAFQSDVYTYTVHAAYRNNFYSYRITLTSASPDDRWNKKVIQQDGVVSYEANGSLNGQNWSTTQSKPINLTIVVQSLADPSIKYTFNIVSATPPKPGTVYYPDYDEEETAPDETPARAEPAEYLVVCRLLNVRQTPSTALPRIGSLRRGDVVQVLSIENGWATIVWEDGEAYVHADYITLAPQQR